ncbi:hypothetical protein F4W09_01990 [Acinetobacter tandoii]|uniref:Uncharacterized protein n=2 Tax=Acinetobacter tandoii TaxID=202954 RepID=A0A5N4WWA2_9GAMM|nr:hypothetical protein F4W09_01990 [Acinetobacter tandoii]
MNFGIDVNGENEKREKIFQENKTQVFENLNYIKNKINDEDLLVIVRNLIKELEKYNSINNSLLFQAILDLMDDTLKDFNESLANENKEFIEKVRGDLLAINSLLDAYITSGRHFQHVLVEYLGKAYKEVSNEVSSFRRARAIADNALTENIYHNAVEKYRGLEMGYRTYFYRAIGITIGLSLLGLFLKNWLVTEYLGNIEFWVLKLSILAVGITLITYFLKQSAHYQRLADQNYQTQVELQAYPSFMESIPTEEAASVRKELALKYFGREIDGAAHKDMSNLISDQMKSTTEMVKAATDVLTLKQKGGSNGG